MLFDIIRTSSRCCVCRTQ